MRLVLAAFLALGVCLGVARAEVPVPPLKARVTDLTGTLTSPQRDELEARIAAYESRRGSQRVRHRRTPLYQNGTGSERVMRVTQQ